MQKNRVSKSKRYRKMERLTCLKLFVKTKFSEGEERRSETAIVGERKRRKSRLGARDGSNFL